MIYWMCILKRIKILLSLYIRRLYITLRYDAYVSHIGYNLRVINSTAVLPALYQSEAQLSRN